MWGAGAVTQSIDDILDLTLHTTARPVLVQASPELRTMATAKIARGDAPAHLVLYRPDCHAVRDYLVASQCGFLIRAFSVPASDRFDLAPSYQGKQDAEQLVTERLRQVSGRPMNQAARLQFRDQMLNGLGVQLRSVPIGLRVDDWIMREYSNLRDQQRTCIQGQIQDNLASLRPDIKGFVPEPIYRGNVGMNAAFAAFWSRAWGDLTLMTPYKVTGYLGLGEELLTIWGQIPVGADQDRHLIQSWADRLEIGNWFEFVPGPNT